MLIQLALKSYERAKKIWKRKVKQEKKKESKKGRERERERKWHLLKKRKWNQKEGWIKRKSEFILFSHKSTFY